MEELNRVVECDLFEKDEYMIKEGEERRVHNSK